MNDWNGAHYKHHSLWQQKLAMDVVNKIPFKGHEAVLDIGCGDGKISRQIAERVPRGEVIGIDGSPSMVEQAKKDHPFVPNLTFLKAKAEDPFLMRKFDFIVSFSALHWVEDHAKVLKNVKFALKEQGKIFFLMLAKADGRVAEVFKRDPWRFLSQNWKKKSSAISEEYYHRLLNQYGFHEDRVETERTVFSFKNLEELKNFFMNWVPYVTELPIDQSSQLAREMAEHICKNARAPGVIELERAAFYVEAHL